MNKLIIKFIKRPFSKDFVVDTGPNRNYFLYSCRESYSSHIDEYNAFVFWRNKFLERISKRYE